MSKLFVCEFFFVNHNDYTVQSNNFFVNHNDYKNELFFERSIMNLLEFFFHTNNLPFAFTGCILVGLMFIEIVSSLVGFQFSGFIDDLFPDIDLDIDFDADADDVPVLTKLFGWIRVGNVPILVLLLAFLFLYTVFGYTIQRISYQLIHHYIYWWIIFLPTILLTVPFLRVTTGFLSKFIIKDETTAITVESLEGAIATITVGIAKKGSPAEAKVVDKHQHTHYVRVEPETDDEFMQGDKVFLMKFIKGNLFVVTEVPDELQSKY